MTTDIFEQARAQGRSLLSEIESKQALAAVGVPVTPTRLATDEDEAVRLAVELGFPAVLKIVSPDLPHKSDAGGVALGLTDEAAVRAAYRGVLSRVRERQPQATIGGVSVQPLAKPGVEVIVGMTRDPQFGPVLMTGLGGVFVEVLEDVAFRLIPIERRDATRMLRELRGFRLLEGYRGEPPVDLSALEGLLLAISRFIDQRPEVEELDLNPIFAYADGAVAVDARIVISAN